MLILPKVFSGVFLAYAFMGSLASAREAERCVTEDVRQETERQPFVTSDGEVEFIEVLGQSLPPEGSRTTAPPSRERTHGVAAKLCNGTFVTAREEGFRSQVGIFGKLLDEQGSTTTSEFEISPFDKGGWSPSIAPTSDGGFVVSWQVGQKKGTAILLQKFTSDARPISSRVRVSGSGHNVSSYVVGLHSGQIVIVWNTFGVGTEMQILARIFTLSVKPLGPPIQVAKGNYIGAAYVRDLCGSSFAVLWQSEQWGNYRPDAARVISNSGVIKTEVLSRKSGAEYSNLLEQLTIVCAPISEGRSSNPTVDPDARKSSARGSP